MPKFNFSNEHASKIGFSRPYDLLENIIGIDMPPLSPQTTDEGISYDVSSDPVLQN